MIKSLKLVRRSYQGFVMKKTRLVYKEKHKTGSLPSLLIKLQRVIMFSNLKPFVYSVIVDKRKYYILRRT